jgi:hypothetical protein
VLYKVAANMGTIVDKLYGEYSAIVSMMDQYNAVSFRNTLNDNFRKTLLLCAASHFEFRITSDVVSFCAEVAGGNSMIPSLVKNKAVSRQYHTWFDWNSSNANDSSICLVTTSDPTWLKLLS